jgi:PhzF family phenazine biosynthesis protein
MLSIAATLGFSETAFVCRSERATAQVRFFTPRAEVALCGHATIATWALLAREGHAAPGRWTMDTRAGLQHIEVREDGLIGMTQNLPQFGATLSADTVAATLGIDDFIADIPIQVVSTGLNKILAPMASLDSLRAIRPDYPAIEALARTHDATGIFAFSLETVDGGTAHCRNFAPVVGIFEDAATGTSCAGVSCLLHRYRGMLGELSFEQGYTIDQPSEIRTRLVGTPDALSEVWVMGSATVVGQREVEGC